MNLKFSSAKMVYRSRFLLIPLLFAYVAEIGSAKSYDKRSRDVQSSTSSKPGNLLQVRVLLEERKIADLDPWSIHAHEPMIITDLANPEKKVTYEGVHVRVGDAGLVVTNTKEQRNPLITKALRIQSPTGHLCLDGSWYQGSFYCIMQDDKALFINNIPIEDYIYSVVKSESFPTWPVEMHKVLAIASRTYVIAKILEAQKYNRLYHVTNTNAHQTYTGYHTNPAIKKAVEETRNLFLAYNSEPIMAMYDICCGGVIPSKKSGVNFERAPYLARTYPCTYCKKTKVFSWSAHYSTTDLERVLQKAIPDLKKLKDIKIVKKDHAGAVEHVMVRAHSGHHHLEGKQLYALLKEVKSFCFSIKNKGETITFDGKGYGHHMGLCQWGARQMVREGWHCRRILRYYYPDTQIMMLNHGLLS